MLNAGKTLSHEMTAGSDALALAGALPRLRDLRFGDKSSLVSLVVIRGAVRILDFAVVAALGLAIAVLYVNEPIVAGSVPFLLALGATGAATVASYELLGLYTLPALNNVVKQMPRLLLGWTAAFAGLLAGAYLKKAGVEGVRVIEMAGDSRTSSMSRL